jgi:hypothetical protein
VSADDSRVIVVRVWRDCGRTIIRVLTGTGNARAGEQRVFSDVDTACTQIAALIKVLEPGTPPIRSVDARGYPEGTR